jgi:methylglutaconyl-CoA hydratase
MRRMADYDHARNVADAQALAQLLQALAGLSKPTIARVHGPAYGGGVGLVACCDIAVAAVGATFALSEAKLGLIPATIGPYVVEAMGARAARRYMLTGERFEAAEAYRVGLVHDLAPSVEALDERVNDLLGALMLAGPHAQKAVKALIRAIAHRSIDERVIADTAERIATVRASDEAREGVAAFLGKRSPAWVPAALRAKKKR